MARILSLWSAVLLLLLGTLVLGKKHRSEPKAAPSSDGASSSSSVSSSGSGSVSGVVYGDCPSVSALLRDTPIVRRAVYHNGGSRAHHIEVFDLLERQRRTSERTHVLFAGSSITAMGYFADFVSRLQREEGRALQVSNLGRGASDMVYHLYCVPYAETTPDVIFAEFRFNDWQLDAQSNEALFRKLLSLRRRDGGRPLLVEINFGRQNDHCDDAGEAHYADLLGHYGVSLVDLCLLTRHCFGRHGYAKWSQYSDDNIHPTTNLSRAFIADALGEWWRHAPKEFAASKELIGPAARDPLQYSLPPPLFTVNAIAGQHTHCQTANANDVEPLSPLSTHGFERKTRVKFGAMGFNNVKSCWQGSRPGDNITFAFAGTRLQVAIYQNSGPMGVLAAYIDGETKPRARLSSFFEGYSWAKGNGRQMILPVSNDLSPGNHTVTFVITDEPANHAEPGHDCQIIALMFAD